MKQCFGYVRVSTLKQGEGVSLEAQRDAIEQFAARNDIVISEWFQEKQTAAKGGRPIFGSMIKALRQRRAAGVVMHKIDRSARNFADWAKIGDLADAGVDVHFATETLDFRSRGGRLSADIQAVIAADYIRNLREETIKGINGRLAQGIYPFRAPIGYIDNGGGKPKTLDPRKATVVRQAFELYATGQHSLRSLRLELTRRGLRNSYGKPLTKGGVEALLNNPFYCGIIRIKRTGATYKGVHEALISASLFQTVQDIKAGRSGKKVTRHNHTYRGLFRCALCHAAMTPERQKGHVYYRCQTSLCMTKCVREEEVELAIRQTLSRVELSDEQIQIVAGRVTRWAASAQNSKETLALQFSQVEARLDALTDALIDRDIDSQTYNRRKESLVLEKARLEEEQQEQGKQQDDPANVQRFLELIKSLTATFLFAEPVEKRQIVEIATSNRRVSGRNVGVEPAKWLSATEDAVVGLFGAHSRPTSRSGQHMRDKNMEAFIAVSRAKEAAKLRSVLIPVSDNDEVDV